MRGNFVSLCSEITNQREGDHPTYAGRECRCTVHWHLLNSGSTGRSVLWMTLRGNEIGSHHKESLSAGGRRRWRQGSRHYATERAVRRRLVPLLRVHHFTAAQNNLLCATRSAS